MIVREWSDRWPNFSQAEMTCKSTGECKMDPAFMDRLQALRKRFGGPLKITSGYRSPAYNRMISDTGEDGPHTTGRAVDIAIMGGEALELIGLAVEMGFTGIGVKQKGEGRFLHLDDLPVAPNRPRPWIWSY